MHRAKKFFFKTLKLLLRPKQLLTPNVQSRSRIAVGHEVKSIIEFIKQYGFGLLVIGFMGHSAIYERGMGGTCQNLVGLAPCSVLVVK